MNRLKISLLCFVLVFIFHHGLWADSTLRISLDALKSNLNKYLILDVRSSTAYRQGHIPGAINFPINFTYANKDVNGKIASPVQMQELLRQRGIDKDSPIVIYDNGDLVDAARLFWALEVYGITSVKVLEQGFEAWKKKQFPVSQKIPQPPRSKYIATIDHRRLASKFTTLLATKNPRQIIIDARARPAYEGKVSTAKRFGHIPTAINIPASHNIAHHHPVSALQSMSALKDLYKDIPRDSQVIIYCAIGRVSSSGYFALRELGYNVANYDASWNEWANDFSLPVEK